MNQLLLPSLQISKAFVIKGAMGISTLGTRYVQPPRRSRPDHGHGCIARGECDIKLLQCDDGCDGCGGNHLVMISHSLSDNMGVTHM